MDNREEIAKIDSENILSSIESLPDQCLHAWEDISKITVPESYKDINKIVMTGMGGSGLGARVIESVYANTIKCPLIRINDYSLPSWIDEKTLVICSSYSGETEETLNGVKQAIEKKAKWMAIGSGNTLIDIAQKHNAPFYKINPKFNLSNQPRMAIAYSIVGQLTLASKAGVIDFSKTDLDKIVISMKNIISSIKVEVIGNNLSKHLANLMKDKIIVLVSSEHLVGSTHVVNNQLNENAKTLSFDFQIPELNHHLMEGLIHPVTNKDNLFFVFFNSSLYSQRIKERFSITKQVVEKNGIGMFEYETVSFDKLSQAFELIQFGTYSDFYLSILYGQNPAPIPWVDYFKNKLGQTLGK